MSRGLSRRQFIKAGAATAALAGAGTAGMLKFDHWLTSAHAESEGGAERIAYTFHQEHCGGRCSLKCTVRDGRLCLIEPNDSLAQERNRVLCLKGLSEVQHVYSADRIQTPMKRVGERGEGEFVAISWDEALETIATTVKELQASYGKNSILCRLSGENNGVGYQYHYIADLLGAQTGGANGQDIGIGNGLDQSFGYVPGSWVGVYFGIATSEPRDWVNSRTILNVGSNFLESSLAQCRCFFDAKDAGAYTITVDPHFTTTASKSDRWVPINPGTDSALLLAMIGIVLDKGWYDEQWLKAHTSFPFLVGEDGALLREHAARPDAEEAETMEDNPWMVWDSKSNTARPATAEDIEAALEGSYTINGRSYRTVFSRLLEQQKRYTPSWAEEITGIEAQVIHEITEQYATAGPAALGFGWGGSDKFNNADILGHAAAVLVALTGNIGIPGGSVGSYVGWWAGPIISFGSWQLPEEIAQSEPELAGIYDYPVKPNNVHAYFSFGDKLTQESANFTKKIEWLKSLDFIVYCDIVASSGSQWADILLPASSKFEAEHEIQNICCANGLVLTNEKILDPLFESKPDFWIENALGEALGYGEYLPKTPRERIEAMLDPEVDERLAGITYERLLASSGGLPITGVDTTVPRCAFTDHRFFTPSGRMEVYYENLVSFDQELPQWEPPLEVYAENELRELYPLQLANMRTRFHIHNQFCDATWIRQFKEPRIELAPQDFAARGLSEGEIVEVFNDRGSFAVKALANECVRPGSVRVVEGNWTKFMEQGNLQNLTNDELIERGAVLPAGAVISFNDTLVEVRKRGGAA
ncbi:MAG: molybdopterin-dependent oxidoreductase [Coriobacteriales bacterium]|jgi:molybdopterin-containing oxidoreductase family molybdopterin binding subunit|nr:molybdopterin-dependent oxidoreductase [Coriobacteriales bacterium]